MNDNASDTSEPPLVILTAKEILVEGLKLVNFTEARIRRVKNKETNITRFKSHYGCNPVVCAQIFEDLQTTRLDEARIAANKTNIHYFLAALHFLKVYETEERREPIFDRSPKTMREWVWYFVRKIQALKHEKIVFPESFPVGPSGKADIWILSVDCTDCPIEEVTNASTQFSQDKKYFSFKENGPALRYEYGLDLFRSCLLWMNGPFFPGEKNDKAIFAKEGLKDKLDAIGKKALGDKIYNGYDAQCSTFNAVDNKSVKKFKSAVQMRHEQFNGMVKEFKCMAVPFRHKPDKIRKHKSCFEAVTVICIYRMENGEPLFDVLAGI